MTTTTPRILTGMRPTGPLHLGHYYGALENWLALQEDHECFFLIADYQALGDYAGNVELIRSAVREVTLDWLAVGLDPNRASFVVQSYVPEHAELSMLLSMIARYSELQRNPTLKAEIARLEQANERVSVGFFTYPVSQVADILLPRAALVPVGEDQLPHVEYTRLLARRFNSTYSSVFPEPEALVGRVRRLVGIDGQAKMSKSLNNALYLSDEKDVLARKVKGMVSDMTGKSPRMSATDPGIVENNPVFLYLDAILGEEHSDVVDLKSQYRNGSVSDGAVKSRFLDVLEEFVGPIRDRRRQLAATPNLVEDVLAAGSDRERELAAETMAMTRDAMRILDYK